jgi:hypothetical protein
MVVVFCTTVGGGTQRDLLNSPFIFLSIFVPDRASNDVVVAICKDRFAFIPSEFFPIRR